MTLDTLIAIGIVFGAALFLYRKLAKTKKSGGCGCAAGGCSTQNSKMEPHSCTAKR